MLCLFVTTPNVCPICSWKFGTLHLPKGQQTALAKAFTQITRKRRFPAVYNNCIKNSVLYCVSFASPKAYEGPIPRSIEALNRLAMPQMQTCCPNAYVLPKCKRYRRRASAARDSGTLRRPFSHPISISTGASVGRFTHLRSPRQASVGVHFRRCPFAMLGPCS